MNDKHANHSAWIIDSIYVVIKFVGTVFIIALMSIQFASTANADFQSREVTALEALGILKKQPEINVLDVRSKLDFKEGHLENAVNFYFYSLKFESNLEKLDKNKTWLVHCRDGERSSKTLELMKAAGFSDVIDLKEGMMGWQKAGLPVVVKNNTGKAIQNDLATRRR